MDRISKEERREKTMRAAQKELAKSGNLQIRIEEPILARVYELANKKGIRYTTMVRDWIVEKLDQEASSGGSSTEILLMQQGEALQFMVNSMNEMFQRVGTLENYMRMEMSRRATASAPASTPSPAVPPGLAYGALTLNETQAPQAFTPYQLSPAVEDLGAVSKAKKTKAKPPVEQPEKSE